MKAALLLLLLFLMPHCVGLSLLKLCGSLCLFLLHMFSVSVRMTSSVFSILLVSLVFCISVVDPTGLKIRITNQALDTLKNQAQAIVQEQLINQPFERFQCSGCTIDKFTIIKLTVHQANLRFRQNLGFQFDIQNSDGRFNFDYQCIKVFSGTTNITAQDLTINMELSLVRTQQRHLTVNMPTCQASVKQITLTDNPGVPQKMLMFCLRKLFNSKLFPWMVQRYGIPYVNQKLASMSSFVVPEGRGITIDFSLTRDVQVMDNSLDVSVNGLVFREGENIPAVDPAVEPVFTQDNLMAYVGVSEFVLNSAAVSFYNAGFLDKKSQMSNTLAKGVLRFFQLFTQPWRLLNANLSAAVNLTEPPRISISQEHGVTVNLRVEVSAESVPADEETRPITSVSATCEVSGRVTIQEEDRLRFPLNNVRCRIVADSWLTTLLVRPLEELLPRTPLLTYLASNFLEDLFKGGVELPLALGLNFNLASFQYQDGFVVVGGNLNWTPAEKQRVLNGNDIGR